MSETTETRWEKQRVEESRRHGKVMWEVWAPSPRGNLYLLATCEVEEDADMLLADHERAALVARAAHLLDQFNAETSDTSEELEAWWRDYDATTPSGGEG